MHSPEDLLHDLNDPPKRAAAILALGELAHVAALDRILSFTRDSDPQVRAAVMTALASFEANHVMAALIGGLHDSDETVRAAAEVSWAKWLLKNVLRLSGAERGYVVMKNPQTGTMEYRAGEKVEAEQVSKPEFAISQDVIAESARTGATILTDNASQDARFSGSQSVVGFSLRQLVAVPLKSGDEILGVVYADRRLMSGMFQPDDLEQLTNFAGQAFASSQHPLPMAGPPPAPSVDDLLDSLFDDTLLPARDDLPAPASDDHFDPPDWLQDLAMSPSEVSATGLIRQGSDRPLDELPERLQALHEAGIDLSNRDEKPIQDLTTLLGIDTADKDDPSVIPDTQRPPTSSIVNFSAYHPAEAVANQQHGLYVYAHLPELASAIAGDVGQFREQLGGSVPAPRVARQSAQLQQGTLITITPECDELDFEPAAITKKWNGQWTRFDFTFQPKAGMVGDSLFVRVSVTVSGVEIAHIKCPIEVVAQETKQPDKADNPLRAAKLAAQTATLYQRIFISYSRRDTQVAEAYRLAQLAVGNEVFMDSYSIRVGEDWRAALAQAIDDADVFQLFWSNAAAESENVRDEWDYALKYKCPDGKCATFIRPVFWDRPMPAPPPALSHLNFRFVPLDARE